ncbi:MAG TPA: porin [Polyangiales bacterium]|nr:porin [Polyangiales bacterium]
MEIGAEPAAPSGEAPAEAAPAEAAPPVTPAPEPVPVATPAPTPTPEPPPAAAEPAPPAPSVDPTLGLLAKSGYPLTPGVTALGYEDAFVLSGFVQAQYEWHQDSSDQQLQGGALLNRDRFVLRRARARVTRDWEWGQAQLEIDGNTTRGPAIRIQKAEVSVLYGRSEDKDQPPIVQLTLGQFDLPFGFEMTYSSKSRWFMERSQVSRALWPGEPDVGVRLSGGYGVLRYSLALTNGEPLDERSGLGLQDPNSNKDITARFGAQSKISQNFVLAGGVSWNQGKGYHAGTDAVKNTVNWRDLNENGSVDQGELFGSPATQATPAENYTRWAVGADLQFLMHTKLGWTMLYGELVLGENMDRGLLIADPVTTGSDIGELGYYVGLTQELSKFAAVGFRFDVYNPNSDFLDKRAGKLIPTSQTVYTYSPMVALTLPNLRLIFQWDIISDQLARDESGVPTDLGNNQWTLRLQGAL